MLKVSFSYCENNKSVRTHEFGIEYLWTPYTIFVWFKSFMLSFQAHIPIGIKITVKKYEKDDERRRYIPDVMLKEKQNELKDLDNPVVRRNLGWEWLQLVEYFC